MTDYEQLVRECVEWQKEYPQEARAQAMKLAEEVGELLGELLKGRMDKAEEEFGDVLIVLTILGICHYNIDPVKAAIKKIAKVRARKGRVVNGIFRKEEDDPNPNRCPL